MNEAGNHTDSRAEAVPTHTPGPWSVYGLVIGEVVTADNGLVASAECPSTGTHAETLANAKLIAAAPDMLAVLKELAAIGIINPTGLKRLEKAKGAVLDAIAKAEGRS